MECQEKIAALFEYKWRLQFLNILSFCAASKQARQSTTASLLEKYRKSTSTFTVKQVLVFILYHTHFNRFFGEKYLQYILLSF